MAVKHTEKAQEDYNALVDKYNSAVAPLKQSNELASRSSWKNGLAFQKSSVKNCPFRGNLLRGRSNVGLGRGKNERAT
jgi:hypothetical protein